VHFYYRTENHEAICQSTDGGAIDYPFSSVLSESTRVIGFFGDAAKP
jgi:hypothetical protein